jgi:hypothetical protein
VPKLKWPRIVRQAIPPISVMIFSIIALLHPTRAWSSTAVTFTVVVVLGMGVCALAGSRVRRAFRGGFAVCCGGYFMLCWLGSPPTDDSRFPAISSFMNTMATTRSLFYLHDMVFPNSSIKLAPDGSPFQGYEGGGIPVVGHGGVFDVPDSEADKSAKPAHASPTGATELWQIVNSALRVDVDTAEDFVLIGQCLWAWILGWLGGIFAQFVARRQSRVIEGQKVGSSAAAAAKPV